MAGPFELAPRAGGLWAVASAGMLLVLVAFTAPPGHDAAAVLHGWNVAVLITAGSPCSAR